MTVEAPNRAPKHCVLLLGASPDVREAVVATLTPLGFEVAAATRYRQALAASSRRRIEIVLSAEQLPDGSWKDVVGRLGDVNEAAPVVVLAEMVDDETWAEAIRLGARDILLLPLVAEDLTRAMSWATSRHAIAYRGRAS